MIMQALSLESYFVKSRNGTWWSPAIFQAFHQSKNKLCKRQGISLYDTLISQTMPIPLWSRCKDFTGLIMHILLPKVKSVLVKGILAQYSAICNFWLSNQQARLCKRSLSMWYITTSNYINHILQVLRIIQHWHFNCINACNFVEMIQISYAIIKAHMISLCR